MRKIPKELLKDITSDPFYKQCCLTKEKDCKIEFHHNLIFKGRQVNEKFCILPLKKEIHDMANKKEIRELLDWIMWNRSTQEQIVYYSKANNYKLKLEYLNKKYGKDYQKIKLKI